MERQRSFSSKPTTTWLLLFSFAIPSSLLACLLLSSCVLRTVPSAPKEAHLHFSAGLERIKAEASSAPNTYPFAHGLPNPILIETHLGEPTNSSVNASNLGGEWKDAILADTQVAEAVDSTQGGFFNNTHLGTTNVSSNGSIEAKITGSHAFRAGNEDSGISYNASARTTTSVTEKVGGEGAGTCDVSDGGWVFDESYPLYRGDSCPFIDEGFSCEANGRMDRDYMKWRWQPHHCNIPRFNPVRLLELIRGKRLVFVGDSINRNQWESMLCLLRPAVSDPSRVFEAHGRRITKERGNYNFKFVDYGCSVEFYVSHFLVHESKARVGQRRVKTLRIDTIDRSSSRWRGADILVFNTAHWWTHYKTKEGLNYYQEGDQVHPHLDVSIAFRKALMTWASWVDRHATPGKTQVIFRSLSPSHFRGGEWNSGGHCKESTQPLNDTSGRPKPEKIMILEQVTKQMRTPVTILNITSLSGLRIDGHPSVYGTKPWKGTHTTIQDCSHWCLPGVPDIWNELLYYHLLSKQEPVFTN